MAALQEAERARISRELHDDVGQLLTALRLAIHRETGAEGWNERRRWLLGLVDEVLARVRNVSLVLAPPALGAFGLARALEDEVAQFAQLTGIRVALRHSGLGRPLARQGELAAFRIVQEALTNVARHAGVAEAAVDVNAGRGRIAVRVEDAGRGFNPGSVRGSAAAGLDGMRDRARSLGGRVRIDAAPGRGTRVTAEIPASPARPDPTPASRRGTP